MGKRAGELVQAVAYLRTSSATNIGADKDSDKRQRDAIAREQRVLSWPRTMSRRN
jgi:hypothetical protein